MSYESRHVDGKSYFLNYGGSLVPNIDYVHFAGSKWKDFKIAISNDANRAIDEWKKLMVALDETAPPPSRRTDMPEYMEHYNLGRFIAMVEAVKPDEETLKRMILAVCCELPEKVLLPVC